MMQRLLGVDKWPPTQRNPSQTTAPPAGSASPPTGAPPQIRSDQTTASPPNAPSQWDTMPARRFAAPEPGLNHNYSWDGLPDLLVRLRIPAYPPPEHKTAFDDMMGRQLAGITVLMNMYGTGDLSRPASRAKVDSKSTTIEGQGAVGESQRDAAGRADAQKSELLDNYRKQWCQFTNFGQELRDKRQRALDVCARLAAILDQSILNRAPTRADGSLNWLDDQKWRKEAMNNVYDHAAATNRELSGLASNMYQCGVARGDAIRDLLEPYLNPNRRRTRCELPGFEVLPKTQDPAQFRSTPSCK